MTPGDLVYRRLHSQRINTAPFKRPGEVVRRLALFQYTIVGRGQIAGTWKRARAKDGVTTETHLFTRPTKAENRAVALAACRYGEFFGAPVVLG